LGGGIQQILTLAILATVPAPAQTVCIGTPAECEEAQKQLCENEPAPANLTVARPVRLLGSLIDSVGAQVDFDPAVSGTKTIIQIRDPKNGVVLFESTLQKDSRFQFELVPAGSFRLIAIWTKEGKVFRLPLADQPTQMTCGAGPECRVEAVIHFHGTDNPIDMCPPK
jgi:hypothetical protein